MKSFCAFILAATVAAPVIPAADAVRIFARAHELCNADDGRLWGVSLCVPMVIADPNTHQAVSNTAMPRSTRDDGVFRLTLPANAAISTAPSQYGGVRFAELIWPTTGSADTRDVTLMHESFHVIQPKLGFNGYAGMGSISGDPFLDTEAGRIWLRGELHALRTALKTNRQLRKGALRDALAMRLYRHSLSTTTADLERQQDVMEGLAEATGIDVGLPPTRHIPYALYDIAFVEGQPSYARSFPYATGPAYSELLDAAEPGWRRGVTATSDIAQMAMRAEGLSVTAPTKSQAQTIIARYDGAAIISQETALAAHKAVLHAKYTRELIAGPTIALPMVRFNITIKPGDIETFDPYGAVYHTLQVSAPWGAITVSDGDAMITKDFRVLRVVAPADVHGEVLHGDGWTLTLAAGYSVVPDPKKAGSYVVSGPAPKE